MYNRKKATVHMMTEKVFAIHWMSEKERQKKESEEKRKQKSIEFAHLLCSLPS